MSATTAGDAIPGVITAAGAIITDAALTSTHLYGGIAVY
jgi:hypothetical protein